ncbi:MAG: hypothetical protein LBQ57_07480, partial [Spirochaetales bacterium]|nr:hypothetical protein [Spirochaetales bacterium]
IPQDLRSKTEELERKARFFAALPQKMRYYNREKVSAVALTGGRGLLTRLLNSGILLFKVYFCLEGFYCIK